MLNKLATAVALATATATASAHVSTGVDKRDAVDQDNSFANDGILADDKKNKMMKPSLRVDGHEDDGSILVNHEDQSDEKPLKQQQRRRAKMLRKDGSSRNSLDLGILGKTQEGGRQRQLAPYNPPCGDYLFEIVVAPVYYPLSDAQICVFDPANPYPYCFSPPPEDLVYNNGAYIATFPMFEYFGDTAGLFSVTTGDSYTCGIPGGVTFAIYQLEDVFGVFREFTVASGTIVNSDEGCFGQETVYFERVETHCKNTKATKSTKATKAPKRTKAPKAP